ncbi:MAG TPA: NAD(P)-dependent oxidoreductase [Rhodothermales bacterium]|nr:NAD(P)-dependent oxidoreductase [Rhodothermales bacterium]
MRKILVTGGAGFVGRHFVRRLLERGDEVHCVDNIAEFTGAVHPSAGWPLFDPREFDSFHFYEQDCRDWFKRVADDDFDYVFHLAAIVGGRLVIENNPLAVAVDLSIDAEYWSWARRTKPAKTVCFSSSAAYPITLQRQDNHVLLKEDMIDFKGDLGMPDLSYGWSKLTCEYLARLAFEKHGLRSVCYRPFSGYGEDQDDTYPFPSICKRAIANRGADVIKVWGTGEQMRDFIHIEDCVTGVLITCDKIDDGDAINLSTGVYTSFKQFARMAAEICGYSPLVQGMSDMPTGVFARGGDTEKQRGLGFEYGVAFLDGIRRAIEYYDRGEG